MAMSIGGGISDIEKLLGKRIKSFRLSAGLTQQQLCNKASISYSTLTKIERGAIKSPSIFTVDAIASAIGISLDKLIGSRGVEERQLKKSPGGISFVYFDINGCLVRFFQRAFISIAEDYGVSPDLVETAFWHLNDDACRGILSSQELNAKMAEKIGISDVDWNKYYLEAAEPVPGMEKLIKSLSQSYKVGLLTNIMPGLVSSLRRAHKIPDISYDAVIDSSEVGHIKPEPEMYKLAQEKAGVSGQEILFVDDTKANLMAAEEFGWHVLWFDYALPDESQDSIRQSLK
jgi:putative hydrolase of the HAD superfamily